jgi:asparagine synthase (glutamine-hydrolysing)
VRFWTLLLNHEADEANRYVERVFALMGEVDVIRFRCKSLPHAVLLQADVELVRPGKDQDTEQRIEALARNAVYSGWVRDTSAERVYSSLNDDDLAAIDPLEKTVIGEFSYAAVGNAHASIVTDHYATHPVYYHRGPRGRWIASNDLRLVLASPDVPESIDRTACSRFLTCDVMIEENELAGGTTFFTAIRKLEPDCVLTIAADGLTHRIARRRGGPALARAPLGTVKRGEYVEAFKEVFDRCVRDRVAAGARGLLLSGGIDSSTVLAACLSSGAAAPFSVSVAFKDPELVMSHDDKLLAALYGTCSLPHEVLYADGILRLPTLGDASAFVDGPDSAANPLVKEACAAALQRRGISLVMTGEGGDIVLGESMHELILDGIRESEGIAGVHRYLTRNLGMRCGSAAHLRKLAEALVPRLAHRALVRSARRDECLALPAFLKPAVTRASRDNSDDTRHRRGTHRFSYVGHRYMHDMLFPRASYFDTLNVQCINSHPFLDPRMIAFALTCPPQVHHDYFNLDRSNPYASAKMLARLAYGRVLPRVVLQKTHKTSYALMARRMFHNSASALYALTERPMVLHEWGLVDQTAFRRQLMAYIVAMENPNANPGLRYHYMRGVCDLETWLRRFFGPRAQIDAHLKFQPLRHFV